MIDLIKRLREHPLQITDEAADLLEQQALSLAVERAWSEKLEKEIEELKGAPDVQVQNAALTGENMILLNKLAAAKREAYKTAVSDLCVQFGVKTVEELEHKIERLESELEGE